MTGRSKTLSEVESDSMKVEVSLTCMCEDTNLSTQTKIPRQMGLNS